MGNVLVLDRVWTVIASKIFPPEGFRLVALVGDYIRLIERPHCVLIHLATVLVNFKCLICSTCSLAFMCGLHAWLNDWWNFHFTSLSVVCIQKHCKVTPTILLVLTQHSWCNRGTLTQGTDRSHTSLLPSIGIREDTSWTRGGISSPRHVSLYLQHIKLLYLLKSCRHLLSLCQIAHTNSNLVNFLPVFYTWLVVQRSMTWTTNLALACRILWRHHLWILIVILRHQSARVLVIVDLSPREYAFVHNHRVLGRRHMLRKV